MKLSRQSLLAAVLTAAGLVFTMAGSAHAQRAVYRTVSGHGQSYSYPCPCPDDGAAADEGTGEEEGTDEETGEDLPEVADLTGDTGFASASQSAAPNAIGDSLYPGINFFNSLAIGSEVAEAVLDPNGRRFKATHNNSAIPQSRVFFNYNYFHDGLFATPATGATQQVSPQNYELGAEYAFWCNMASVQVRVPMNYGFENELATDTVPLATGSEFGNVQVALKTVLCQDACTTWTAGLGVDLPTADDLVVADVGGLGDLVVSNDVITLSPYLATLRSIGCNAFAQAFAQVAIPLDETDVTLGTLPPGSYEDPTLLYLDLSLGYWLHQDCCGNGLLALAELHYTNALTDDAVDLVPGTVGIAVGDYEMLNATIGVSAFRNCWTVTPAVVLPILEDAVWDYEFAVQVNRRF